MNWRLHALSLFAHTIGVELQYIGRYVDSNLQVAGKGRAMWKAADIGSALEHWNQTVGEKHGNGTHHFVVEAILQRHESMHREIVEDPSQVNALTINGAVSAGAAGAPGDGATATSERDREDHDGRPAGGDRDVRPTLTFADIVPEAASAMLSKRPDVANAILRQNKG